MIEWPEILLRLALAAFFGAAIGLERERKDWAAGLRTHMMVCLGSALTMIVSAYGFSRVLGGDHITLDPSRIAAQVISGIGFIGAGTILFLRQGVVKGLTTASGLWTVAAIGLATGSGMYRAALITTVLAIDILWLLQPVERRFLNRFKRRSVRIVTGDRLKSIDLLNSLFESRSLEVVSFSMDKQDKDFVISLRFKTLNKSALRDLLQQLQADEAVKEVNWSSS